MRTAPLLAAVTLALVGAACGNDGADDESDAAAPAEDVAAPAEDVDGGPTDGDAIENEEVEDPGPDLQVVSTVAPIADVVAQVLGDRGTVTTLVPAGMDSHTYEPSPGDVAPLTEADLFVGNGLDLNAAAVELAEANLPDGAPLVLLGDEALDPGELTDEHWHDHGDGAHTHSHDDGADHSHSHDDGADHSHGGNPNPHVWTSVPNVLAYVDVVETTLTDLDPEGADGYAQRADDYREQLESLDAAIHEAVGTLDEGDRKLVVYHDAWAYFGREYDVEVIAAVQPSDYSEPSAADVRAIIDQIRAEDVPAVFGAEEFPTGVAATIADETGAEYVGELADDTLPGDPGDPDHTYVGMMVTNVGRIVDALGGDASALQAPAR